MFKETIQAIVDGTEGGLSGMLMDFEGIPVEVYTRDNPPFDIEVVGAEASVLVKSIRRATEMLEAGATKEVAIQSDKLVTLIRVLNDNYFLAMTLAPGGNFGKARFLLRAAAPDLVKDLV